MHLLHGLSNPSRELECLFQSLTKLDLRQAPAPTAVPTRTKAGHRRNGTIQQAVDAVLIDADEPLRPRDIRQRVSDRLGGSVSYSAISYSLGNDPRHPAPHLSRDTRGRYSLKRHREPEV